MSSRLQMTLVLTVTAAFGAACDVPPAQAPNEVLAAPATSATTAAPAPPPPKCEWLEEKCTAGAGKRARVAGSPLTFEPVEGWIYAQGKIVTVVQSVDNKLWFAVAGYDAGDPRDSRKAASNRDAQLEVLGRELQVTPPKKKVFWKKADAVEDVGELKVSLWEIEGAARAGHQGSILVFAASPMESNALLGMAFVPEHDQSSAADLIMKSIKSISLEVEQ